MIHSHYIHTRIGMDFCLIAWIFVVLEQKAEFIAIYLKC